MRTIETEARTILFTVQDRERLDKIAGFVSGLRNLCRLNEFGHNVELLDIEAILSPAAKVAEDFCLEIHSRFIGK